jgi:nucleoside-diphosphate-sugar epimerase
MASLQGEKILVTGPAGQIAFPLAASLAADNEVWGVARFSEEGSRQRVEDAGVRTMALDLAEGDYSGLPSDFTVLLHLAAYQGPELNYDHAIRVNAEATGLIMQHCREARAALVMSTQSVYRPNEDHAHVFAETDPLGEVNASHAPTYAISKIAQEAVARTTARLLHLPVVIGRMNVSYGPNGGLPMHHVRAILAGHHVPARWDPYIYSPIHQDDINGQVGDLINAATVPGTIVNWAGDEAVTVQEWAAYLGELLGRPAEVTVTATAGTQRGSHADVTKRRSITGPCTVNWRDGFRTLV